MKKPDDDMKLDINEIFGGDWTEGAKLPPEPIMPDPPPSVLPDTMDELPGAEIKFNDESSVVPKAEPVVITVIQKQHRMPAPASDEDMPLDVVPDTSEPTQATGPVPVAGSSLLVQAGSSGRTTDVPVNREGASMVMKPGVSARKEPTFEDYIGAYDRFRLVFIEELKATIDIRKISMMFVKTFEAARERHVDVFRNANWDASGNLLEDGSLNIMRVQDNKNALDPKSADVTVDNALQLLFNLRIQAVEKGLGPDYGIRIKTQIRKWIDTESKKNGFGKNDPKVLQHLSNFLL